MIFECPECGSIDIDFVDQCGLVTDYVCTDCQHIFTDGETEKEQESEEK